MFLISLLILLVCVGVSAAALWFLLQAINGEGKRRLVTGARGVLSGVPDGTGISALCSDVWSCEQLEDLLAVEYPRYEVVVVLDSQVRKAAFDAIIEQYHLIRVTYPQYSELPVTGIRALYRSKRRCFRRLVLVDKTATTPEEDFNAALGAATYENLLPVYEGWMPVPGAVERLVIELSGQPHGEIELIRAVGGAPAVLYNRQLVVREGGFGPRLGHTVHRARRRTLYEALFSLPARRKNLTFAVAAVVALVAVAGFALVMEWLLLLAVVLTVGLVWIALAYAAPLVGGICRFGECAVRKYIAG